MENCNALKGKRLLILAGSYLHLKVVEAAKELGLFTIVIDHDPNSPAKRIANKSYDITVSNVDKIVEISLKEKIDAVITINSDYCQIYYQEICEKLGLPCWGTSEQFSILTEKERFKELCALCNIDTIPSYTEQEIVSKSDTVVYPILIKPSRGSGSRASSVCYSQADAIEKIKLAKDYSSDNKAIIEKYMGGKEDFQVTYLVVDGTPFVVRTADRFLGKKELGMDRVAIALSSPSRNTDLYFSKVHKNMVKLIETLGIKNAPVFFQGFVDEGTIRFYDPGLRFPGGEYDRVFSEVMGINLMKSLIELAFTGQMTFSEGTLNEKTAYLKDNIIFTLHSTIKSGTISYETSIEDFKAINGVRYVAYRHTVGETVEMTYNVNQRIAEINILGKNISDIVKTIHEVQNKISVLDENGDSMIFCEFDTDDLKKDIVL